MSRYLTRQRARVLGVIFLALGVSLLAHWEPSQESWGYWLFSRIFNETGQFIIPGRSPLYSLYLVLFRWMGYPLSVSVEYLVTSLLTVLALMVLFREYLNRPLLTLAVILWIPFLQISEPPVQKLALACSCLAIALRNKEADRFRMSLSYALLILASMFRNTYSVCFLIFLVWDGWKVFREKKGKNFFKVLSPQGADWPILVVLGLLTWFNVAQSAHRWNNAHSASTQWFPGDSKSLSSAAFFQHYNDEYIAHTYGNYEGKDFYQTNNEAFHGADTIQAAFIANPGFIARELVGNCKRALIIASKFILLPAMFYDKIPKGSHLWYLVHPLVTLPLMAMMLYGAFRGAKTADMRLFLGINILLIFSTILALPKERYMHPLIPLLMTSACWYGQLLKSFWERMVSSSGKLTRWNRFIAQSMMAFSIVFFSQGTLSWAGMMRDLVKDWRQGEWKVLESREYSEKASKQPIELLIKNCHGIMTENHRFIGAFMPIPLNHIYDIWEIPPFGYWGDPVYDGLRPERIDCVLVTSNIVKYGDGVTNSRLRYDLYLKPYMEHLQQQGAKVYAIEQYGQAVILEKGRD